MAKRYLQSRVTKTGAFAGPSLSISNTDYPAGSPDWYVQITLHQMPTGHSCRFAVYDSVDGFTNKKLVGIWNPVGATSLESPRSFSIHKRDCPNVRFGTANAVLRLELEEITGSSPSVTYEALLDDAQ